MVVRKNLSAASLKLHGGYRARVGIAVKFLDATHDGLPSSTELSTLNELEDALALALEARQDAIHVLTITTSGFREHVFYAKETVDIGARLCGVGSKFNRYELQSYASEDAGWRVYGEFG